MRTSIVTAILSVCLSAFAVADVVNPTDPSLFDLSELGDVNVDTSKVAQVLSLQADGSWSNSSVASSSVTQDVTAISNLVTGIRATTNIPTLNLLTNSAQDTAIAANLLTNGQQDTAIATHTAQIAGLNTSNANHEVSYLAVSAWSTRWDTVWIDFTNFVQSGGAGTGDVTWAGSWTPSVSNGFGLGTLDKPYSNIFSRELTIGTGTIHLIDSGYDVSFGSDGRAYVNTGASDIVFGDVSQVELDAVAAQADDNASDIAAIDVILDHTRENVYLNRFQIQENATLTGGGMVDGYADSFADESWVDSGVSSNDTYIASNNWYVWDYTPSITNGGDTLLENLCFWYHFDDDAATTNVVDSSGRGIDAGFMGGNTADKATNGLVGGALYLDGTDDAIQLPITANLMQGSFSLSLWFLCYDQSSSDDTVFYTSYNSPGTSYGRIQLQADETGALSIYQRDAGSRVICNYAPNIGSALYDEWWHVVWTVNADAGVSVIWTNGALAHAETNASWTPFDSTLPYRMGMKINDATADFLGAFDETAAWTGVVLTASQVTNLYNGGAPNTNFHLIGGTPVVTPAVGGNMLWKGTNGAALALTGEPTNGTLILAIEDADSDLTINTDVKGYISRDGGTTEREVFLDYIGPSGSDGSIYSGTTNFIGAGGTNMVPAVRTFNDKDGALKKLGIYYD